VDMIWYLLLIATIPVIVLITKHKKSRREFAKGIAKTTLDTVSTFTKGLVKTGFKSGRTAFKEERRHNKDKRNNW